MSQLSSPDRPEAVLLTNQILNGALVAGPLIFLGIALFVRASGKDGLIAAAPFDTRSPLLLVAIALAVANVLLAWFLPPRVVAAQRRLIGKDGGVAAPAGAAVPNTKDGRLMAAWTTSRIIALALIEGAAFFATIVFMMEGSALALVAALALLVAMAIRFPTATTLEAWLDQQHELMQQDRLD
jgi:hypothetical protein